MNSRLLPALAIVAWVPVAAIAENPSCPCDKCETLIRKEFVETGMWCTPRLIANASSPEACWFEVLDIRFQVQRNANGTVARVDEVSKDGANQYTSGCRACLEGRPNCSVVRLVAVGYAASWVDLGLAVSSVVLEVYSLVKFVTGKVANGRTYFQIVVLYFYDAISSGDICIPLCVFFPVLLLGCLSPFAGVSLTIARLFPGSARYSCATMSCNKLTHNAVMSLSSAAFDAAEIFLVFLIEKNELYNLQQMSSLQLGSCGWWWFKWARPWAKASKGGSLACSVAWLVYDLEQVATTSPGPGTLALGVIAAAAGSLLFFLEVRYNFLLVKRYGLFPQPWSAEAPEQRWWDVQAEV